MEAVEWVWAHRDVSRVLVSGSQGTEFESVLWRVTDAQVERVARDFRRLQEAGAVDQELDPHLFGSVVVGAYLLLAKQMARLSQKPDLATWARTLHRLFQEGTMPRLDAPPVSASTPARATCVGSGTVARTERLPIERRAEAAVIAWMRHQAAAYDTMRIARVKGARREVRRELAEISRAVLDLHRHDVPHGPTACLLCTALAAPVKLRPDAP